MDSTSSSSEEEEYVPVKNVKKIKKLMRQSAKQTDAFKRNALEKAAGQKVPRLDIVEKHPKLHSDLVNKYRQEGRQEWNSKTDSALAAVKRILSPSWKGELPTSGSSYEDTDESDETDTEVHSQTTQDMAVDSTEAEAKTETAASVSIKKRLRSGYDHQEENDDEY